MSVADSAPRAVRRSVCIIRTTVINIPTDTEHCAGLSAIAEPPVVTIVAACYLHVLLFLKKVKASHIILVTECWARS